ncbi:hypothetical protein AVEN_257382-1 [Araneus ventricosus]|uniref:Uncharacterized protein n=1 Tax=Araneus ventricosus TaxID=182803 RepID=A0A4Y2CAQ8_ARAVE|nr:hypothetical protein AVEN_257382-1 [Araneus ventricosus]
MKGSSNGAWRRCLGVAQAISSCAEEELGEGEVLGEVGTYFFNWRSTTGIPPRCGFSDGTERGNGLEYLLGKMETL